VGFSSEGGKIAGALKTLATHEKVVLRAINLGRRYLSNNLSLI
jgi:hypothetical protein